MGRLDTKRDCIVPLVLVYRGPLSVTKEGNRRLKEKQRIRRYLHVQLSNTIRKPYAKIFGGAKQFRPIPIGQFRFHPLICRHEFYPRIGCALDIHALSYDPFGSVLQSGDLDNRLKTLFDALRLPSGEHELPKDDAPGDGEDPFWVLLSDDRMITDLHITQDILHTPRTEADSYIELTIRVAVKPGDVA
jgi:hypothetical protein